MNHELFMQRCLFLAQKGQGNVAPNPMVGSVIVHNGEIIGEGYHQQYGEPHAEVNAINSVKNKELLLDSTLYVNLEPCSHFGKTPPCSNLIIENKIPHVVIGAIDDNAEVAGKGVKKLESAGIKVEIDILKKECLILNKRFYKAHNHSKPYVILKWAESSDGFISKPLLDGKAPENNWITGPEAKSFVHQMRANEQAILIGKNTAVTDNPSLTTRNVEGSSPVRVIVCNSPEELDTLQLLTDKESTLIFNTEKEYQVGTKRWIKFNGELNEVLDHLHQKGIQSIIIEGGTSILNQFITQNIWDEAFQFIGKVEFEEGIKAPVIKEKCDSTMIGNDKLNHYINSCI